LILVAQSGDRSERRDARIRDLRDALRSFETLGFPEDSSCEEELSEAHAELAQLDGHIVGLIQSLLAGERVPVSDLRADPELRNLLEQAADPRNGVANARTAVAYLTHLSELERLITLARIVAH
jgi:hypothetical protein